MVKLSGPPVDVPDERYLRGQQQADEQQTAWEANERRARDEELEDDAIERRAQRDEEYEYWRDRLPR